MVNLMAIAGGMTTAYKFFLKNGELNISATTYPSDKCHTAQEAVNIVKSGNVAIVRGGAVVEFNTLWKKANATN